MGNCFMKLKQILRCVSLLICFNSNILAVPFITHTSSNYARNYYYYYNRSTVNHGGGGGYFGYSSISKLVSPTYNLNNYSSVVVYNEPITYLTNWVRENDKFLLVIHGNTLSVIGDKRNCDIHLKNMMAVDVIDQGVLVYMKNQQINLIKDICKSNQQIIVPEEFRNLKHRYKKQYFSDVYTFSTKYQSNGYDSIKRVYFRESKNELGNHITKIVDANVGEKFYFVLDSKPNVLYKFNYKFD